MQLSYSHDNNYSGWERVHFLDFVIRNSFNRMPGLELNFLVH